MFSCCSAAALLNLETDCCSPLSRQVYLLRSELPNNAMLQLQAVSVRTAVATLCHPTLQLLPARQH